jgi:hypothetical protein
MKNIMSSALVMICWATPIYAASITDMTMSAHRFSMPDVGINFTGPNLYAFAADLGVWNMYPGFEEGLPRAGTTVHISISLLNPGYADVNGVSAGPVLGVPSSTHTAYLNGGAGFSVFLPLDAGDTITLTGPASGSGVLTNLPIQRHGDGQYHFRAWKLFRWSLLYAWRCSIYNTNVVA